MNWITKIGDDKVPFWVTDNGQYKIVLLEDDRFHVFRRNSYPGSIRVSCTCPDRAKVVAEEIESLLEFADAYCMGVDANDEA
jgi:hypothetical protein